MRRDEIPAYVENRLALCGWAGDPAFTEDAYDALFDYSGGVPRKLNNLCARVLLFGALEEKHEIDESIVREVTDDLQRDNAPRDREKIIQPNSGSLAAVPAAQQMQPVTGTGGGAVAALDDRLLARIDRLEHYASENDRNLRQVLRILSDLVEQNEVERGPYGVSRSA
jgi:general secretion pathway protein A